MTEKDELTTTRELLRGMLRKGWKPGNDKPREAGEYRDLIGALWDEWNEAESEEPGTGHVAVRTVFKALNKDGKYAYLLSSDPKPLPDREKDYSTNDYKTVLAQEGYEFALDVCNNSVVMLTEIGTDDQGRIDSKATEMSDIAEAVIHTKLRDRGLNRMNVAHDAIIAAAAANPYHPVTHFLDSLHWDGKDHLSAFSAHFQDRHGVFSTFFRRWAIGAVAKAYGPTQNRMLVLDGEQNAGKSSMVAWLASPLSSCFMESAIIPESNDHLLRLMRIWIWEVGELGSTIRRADREALKHFLTMEQVTARKPYDKHDLAKPALTSFVGTFNNDSGLLNDPTGSRRFMVCHIDKIDWSYSDMDVHQIWAQVSALYRSGEQWRLTLDEAARATVINAEYEVPNPLGDLLKIHFEIDPSRDDWEMRTVDILDHLHTFTSWKLRSLRSEQMSLASTLKGIKVSSIKMCVDGNRTVSGYSGIRLRKKR